jgi:uracil-DNA glycosylase
VAAADRTPSPATAAAGQSPALPPPDAAGSTVFSGPVRLSTVPSGPAPPAAPEDARTQLTELEAFARQVAGCTRCRLHEGRTQVVFGVGDPHADLMFVGEAPGFHEDKQGYPFVGQAGKLLDKLLAGIGLERSQVYIANVIKCRPPGNRDPVPDEKEACEPYLFRQVELIRPKVIATLGNHATKQLSGKETGITRVHGQEQQIHVGSFDVLLYPLYHPAAALYTPAMLTVLEQDFARLPELLGRKVAAAEPAAPQLAAAVAAEPAVQLGLF